MVRRFLRGLARVLAAFVALLVVAYVVVTIVGRQALTRELERVKASGAPVSWDEVIPPPVPDDQNAALLYEKAFAALALATRVPRPRYPPYPHPSSGESEQRKALSEYLSAPTREERKALEKGMRKVLADNAPALSYARQAAKRPECRFDRDWSDPVAMTMPEYARFQTLSKLACADGLVRSDLGDQSGAFSTWSLNLSLLKYLGPEPTLLGQLTRYAILAVATVPLSEIVQGGGLSPEECRRVDGMLRQLDLENDFVKGLEAERTVSLWMWRRYRETPKSLAQMAGSPASSYSPRERSPISRFFLWLGCRAVGTLDDAALLRYWDRQMALLRRPYYQNPEDFTDRLREEIPRCALLTRMHQPVFMRARTARDKGLAHAGLMRIGLGLATYRTHFGRYPDALDELRKALEWEVPEDPFSGGDFIYRRAGNGCLLYSLGPDLDDDGGTDLRVTRVARVGKPPRSGIDGDIVWRMER